MTTAPEDADTVGAKDVSELPDCHRKGRRVLITDETAGGWIEADIASTTRPQP